MPSVSNFMKCEALNKRCEATNDNHNEQTEKRKSITKIGESRVLLIADSGRWGGNATKGFSQNLIEVLATSSDYCIPYARHNGKLNGLLLDGHVEAVDGPEMFDKFGWIRHHKSSSRGWVFDVNTITNVLEGKWGAATKRNLGRHVEIQMD